MAEATVSAPNGKPPNKPHRIQKSSSRLLPKRKENSGWNSLLSKCVISQSMAKFVKRRKGNSAGNILRPKKISPSFAYEQVWEGQHRNSNAKPSRNMDIIIWRKEVKKDVLYFMEASPWTGDREVGFLLSPVFFIICL
ncbi:MAG: hypothetical protein PUE21_08765 [Lachnospiraceae bacterium]|nr:hypothetical protein [Lachnospiraceae bacterium]